MLIPVWQMSGFAKRKAGSGAFRETNAQRPVPAVTCISRNQKDGKAEALAASAGNVAKLVVGAREGGLLDRHRGKIVSPLQQ